MRNYLLFFSLIVYVLLSPIISLAQTPPQISSTPAKLEKKDGFYILSGTVDKDKHKDTDPVPLSTISITASFYTYPKEGGETPVLVLPAIGYRSNSSITDEEKLLLVTSNFPFKGIAENGVYHFLISNPPLNENTIYTIIVSFTSTSGAKREDTFRATTEKGVIPGTEEAFINERSYRLLAPIPGMTLLLDPELCQAEQQAGKAGQICDINAFINFLLSLAIGAAAVVLVVRIIISGYSYMTTDIPFLKAKTKGQFVEALIGLLVALSSYLILNTISPRLVSNDLKIGAVSFDVEEMGTDLPLSQIQNSFLKGNLSSNTKEKLAKMPLPAGVQCPGETGGKGDLTTVALSFMNKVTYNNTPQRGTSGPQGTILLDCSLYVNTVLGCAGVTPKTADFTGDMYNKGEKITGPVEVRGNVGYINNKALKPGDLVGVYEPNGSGAHHVWIYIGNGEILDAQTNKRAVGKSVVSKERLEAKVYGYKLNFVVRY